MEQQLLNSEPKEEPHIIRAPFFEPFVDYCMSAEFCEDRWLPPSIVDRRLIMLPTSVISLHYAQSVFEGCIAMRQKNGNMALFRIEENLARLNRSATRMKMPLICEEHWKNYLIQFVNEIDRKGFIPTDTGTLLYLRPIYFAADSENLGVRAGEKYELVVLACTINTQARHQPEKMMMANYPRAFPGGTGNVKASANYGHTLIAKYDAKEKGYDNVLFPDYSGLFVEEACANNIFFCLGSKEVYTPSISSGTILPGITRNSVIRILRSMGIIVYDQEKLSIHELREWARSGLLSYAFTTGTAGGISVINTLNLHAEIHFAEKNLEVVDEVRETIRRIQLGYDFDQFSWMTKIA